MSGGAGEVPGRAHSLPHVWRGARNACWYTNSTVILPGLEALEGYMSRPPTTTGPRYRSRYYRRGGESTLATSLSGRSNERVSTSNNNDNTYAQYLTSTVYDARTVANRRGAGRPARAAARAGVRGRAGAPRANALYTPAHPPRPTRLSRSVAPAAARGSVALVPQLRRIPDRPGPARAPTGSRLSV